MLKFKKNTVKPPSNGSPVTDRINKQETPLLVKGKGIKQTLSSPAKGSDETFRARRRQFLSPKNAEFIQHLINAV